MLNFGLFWAYFLFRIVINYGILCILSQTRYLILNLYSIFVSIKFNINLKTYEKMKTVVSPEQVAHLWAHQTQLEAKTPGHNLYFFKEKIFSYGSHFEIARHVVNKKGEKAVFFTTRSYSNATAKHISIVRAACSHFNKIHIPAKDFDTYKGEQNFQAWLTQLEDQFKLLAKARKKEIYLSNIKSLSNDIKIYVDFTGFPPPKELRALLNASNTDEFTAYYESKSKLIASRLKAEKAKQAKKDKQTLLEWRAFELPRLYSNKTGFDYLRYNSEKKRIETSQNVEVPIQIAKDFYLYILSILSGAGACVDCDFKILNYDVKSIDKDKIVIGCHTIKIDECNTIAKQLGWIK